MVQYLVSQAVAVICLTAYMAELIDGTLLRQQWVTTDSSRIPMTELRANCKNGPLVTENGAPLTGGKHISLSVVKPDGCQAEDQWFTNNKVLTKAYNTRLCYNNPQCKYTSWSASDLGYTCRGGASLEDQIRLKMTIYCQAPEDLSLIDLTSLSTIQRTRTKCQDGRKTRVSHIFVTNSCPKPLVTPDGLKQELSRLASALSGCESVDTSGYNLGEPTCQTGGTHTKGVGIYWSCNAHTAATALNNTGVTEARNGSDADATERPQSMYKQDMKYLTALVVVSVLLVLVIITLVAVVIHFLRAQRRTHRKFSMSTISSGPPSRHALYSRVSDAARFCDDGDGPSSICSSMRYVPENRAGVAKLNEKTEGDYSIPLGEGDYENADDEDTYEAVDTHRMENLKGDGVQRAPSAKYSYGYMIPVNPVKGFRQPARTASEKYSNGYLLPTMSKVK